MAFSPDYIRTVLTEHFEDAKALLLAPLLSVHRAHLVMLAETGIVSRSDARAIRDALDGLDLPAVRAAAYDGSCEDLYFFVDRLLSTACGADAAGRLHTARSRNDIDMTMYRMRLREDVLTLLDATLAVRRALAALAAAHRETIFPAHTHTQPAQPTTLAHYLLAVIEERERDADRLLAAYGRVNRCPLGACAITGTGFPIDRRRTSELLGFDGPTGNTYGSIATVDYLLEACGAAVVTLAGLGRVVQDLLLWCTAEVGYLRLSDQLVQASSIMPQKRNPVALEHARALLSKALGQVQAVALAVHNTPYGDIVDTEDDLQPLVASAFRDASRGVRLVAIAADGAAFDTLRMRARAEAGWVTATELADTLARDHGLPFSTAHQVVARLVESGGASRTGDPERLARATREIAGREIRLADDELARVLSPEHFVRVRRTAGGPAPEVTAAALADATASLERDETRLGALRGALAAAEARLRAAAAAL